MPLADHGRLITNLLQQFRKRLLRAVKVIAVVHKTIQMVVLTRQNDGATRTANRIRAKAITERHALSSQLVNVRRWIDIFEPTVVRTNRVRRMIIGKNKQDIWAVGGRADRRRHPQYR